MEQKAQFEALSGVAAAIFDGSCSQLDSGPVGIPAGAVAALFSAVCLQELQRVWAVLPQPVPLPRGSVGSVGSVSRCSRDGMSRPGCQRGAPLEGGPVLSHATARASQAQPALRVKLVPADENALRCVFAWRNWERVCIYLYYKMFILNIHAPDCLIFFSLQQLSWQTTSTTGKKRLSTCFYGSHLPNKSHNFVSAVQLSVSLYLQ